MMKQAYVSLIVAAADLTSTTLRELVRLDGELDVLTRGHEILVALPLHHCASYEDGVVSLASHLSGPLTIIHGTPGSDHDELMIEGLARAAGDFIIEWEGDLGQLTAAIVSRLLATSDEGAELVEVLPAKRSVGSRLFFWFANRLRPDSREMRSVVGRIISRRIASEVLESSLTPYGTYRLVIFSQQHLERSEFVASVDRPQPGGLAERIGQAIDVLIVGTRISSRIPTLFALICAVIGLSAAVYGVSIFLFREDTPEGWTSLLVFLGIATAGLFAVLALISGQMRILGRARNHSPTRSTEIIVPFNIEHMTHEPTITYSSDTRSVPGETEHRCP